MSSAPSPHSARTYFSGAALHVVHHYVQVCDRRKDSDQKALLTRTREIDLCAKLANYFGASAYLAAQGVPNASSADIEVSGVRLKAQVKYFRPSARHWSGKIKSDWEWLLETKSNYFRKRAWVVFLPSSDLFDFSNCLSVPRGHRKHFRLSDFAPFAPFVEVKKIGKSTLRLVYKKPRRLTVLHFEEDIFVRVSIVGSIQQPIWCAIYTRISPKEAERLASFARIEITHEPVPSA